MQSTEFEIYWVVLTVVEKQSVCSARSKVAGQNLARPTILANGRPDAPARTDLQTISLETMLKNVSHEGISAR